MSRRVIFILGCTGCGKGALGRELARRLGAEIISIDSMKLYRRMDVGTAKPPADIRAEIPHHMIDVIEPSEEYSVAEFVAGTERAIEDIAGRGKPVLCVGGTALYLKALIEGLFEGPSADPAIRKRLQDRAAVEGNAVLHGELVKIDPVAAERIHPNDLRRIVRAMEVYELTGTPISELQVQWDRERTKHDISLIGLRRERDAQSRRTNLRVKRMVEMGLVDEVRQLVDEPLPLSNTARKAVGYAEIIDHFQGKLSLDEAIEQIKINTRHLAKSQRTWFKRFLETEWIDLVDEDTAEGVAERLMEKHPVEWWSRTR